MDKYTTDAAPSAIPAGFCQCGCGQRTTYVTKENKRLGYSPGQFCHYAANHNGKRNRAHNPLPRLLKHIGQGSPNECWEWMAHRNAQGYGKTTVLGKPMQAHRAVWTALHGEIPRGMLILHCCDNPPCCNPAHLYLGTQMDNVQDMIRRKRYKPSTWTVERRRDQAARMKIIGSRKR